VNKIVQADALPDLRQSETIDLPEAKAIRLAHQGDASAFECIYRLHSRRAYNLCLRMVGNATEAEDLTQDIFLQVFCKIQTFRGEAAFSTWLHRLAVNIVLIRLRRKKPAQTSLDEAIGPNEEMGKPPKEFGGPDLRLSRLMDRLNVDRAVGQLPMGYRSVFVLHDIQGYVHNEIAEILGCSVGNSKSQLHKARRRLRQELHGDSPELDSSVVHSGR
jgi:RNA polymerase sigma-70 factor (ECF subfamily)